MTVFGDMITVVGVFLALGVVLYLVVLIFKKWLIPGFRGFKEGAKEFKTECVELHEVFKTDEDRRQEADKKAKAEANRIKTVADAEAARIITVADAEAKKADAEAKQAQLDALQKEYKNMLQLREDIDSEIEKISVICTDFGKRIHGLNYLYSIALDQNTGQEVRNHVHTILGYEQTLQNYSNKKNFKRIQSSCEMYLKKITDGYAGKGSWTDVQDACNDLTKYLNLAKNSGRVTVENITDAYAGKIAPKKNN